MKKLTLAALLLVAGAALWAAVTPQRWLGFKSIQPISASDPSGIIVSDDFEGANNGDPAPNWIVDVGTLAYITNSPVMQGSFCYYFEGIGATAFTHTNFAGGTADMWMYYMFNIGQLPGAQAAFTLLVNNSVVGADVDYGPSGEFYLTDATSATSVGLVTAGVTYQVWIHFVSGSTIDVWVSDNGTRDNLGGNYHLQVTASAITPTRVYFGAQNRTPPLRIRYDKLRVSTSQIGDNPP